MYDEKNLLDFSIQKYSKAGKVESIKFDYSECKKPYHATKQWSASALLTV